MNKEITNKLSHLKDLMKEVEQLDQTELYTGTWDLDMDVVTDMYTLLNKIDLRKLSGKTRDEVRELEKDMITNVYVYHSRKSNEHIAQGNLIKDLLTTKKRLEEEKRIEDIQCDINNTKKVGDIGELYGSDEVLDKAKDLIIKLSREYVYIETTNILQYKLRL